MPSSWRRPRPCREEIGGRADTGSSGASSEPIDSTTELWNLDKSSLMRQSRWHGRFLELHNEIAYQQWHTSHWIHRLQFALIISGLIGLAAFFMGLRTSVSLKAGMIRAYPDKAWMLYANRILASCLPIVVAIALFSKRMTSFVVSKRLYQPLPLTVFGIFVILEALPTIWIAGAARG